MAATPAAKTAPDSIKAFVQSFYDWYVPAALAYKDGFSYELVLKQKPYYFDNVLSQALREDWKARDNSPEYIAGLEADPILNSQDPCDHYIVGAIRQVGKSYEVDVFCGQGVKQDAPDVTAELIPQGDTWRFTNFIYPARDNIKKTDLLSVLKRQKKSREKISK